MDYLKVFGDFDVTLANAHQAGRGQNFFTIDKRWDLLGFEEYIPRVNKIHLLGKST